MSILSHILTKLGRPDMPASSAFTEALADVNARIDKNRTAARALTDELPGAVIRSIDAGATERRRLSNLESEYSALLATASAIRRELDEALAGERAAQTDEAWNASAEDAAVVIAAAHEIDTIIETLAEGIEALRDAIGVFDAGLPTRGSDYRSELISSAASYAAAALGDRLQRALEIRSLAAIAKEETAVAFKARPSKQQEQSGAKAA